MPQRGWLIEVVHLPQVGGAEMLVLMLSEQWHRQGRPVRICCLYGRDGPLVKIIKERGMPCDLLDIEALSFVRRWWRLFRYFRHYRPSAVHVHHMGVLINVLPAAYLSGCRNVVVTEHSMLYLLRHARLRRLVPLLARGVSKIVCVSQRLRAFFLEQGVPREKLTTIYNGIDTARFGREDGPRTGVLTIGAIGRLVEEKDYPNLFKALVILKRAGLSFEARIIGDGPLSGDLHALRHELGFHESVRFLGQRNDIPDVLRGLDIYVLSSKSEGLPIAVLEAMAAGLPIVATDVGGVGEIIEHERNGLLVKSGDPLALAQALARVAGDRVLRARLGEAALNDVRMRYSITPTAEHYARTLGFR